MNNWILPTVQEEIDLLKEKNKIGQEEALNKQIFSAELKPNYVLIDAALWNSDINIFFEDDTVKYKSLFRGSTGEELWSVAPYLVDISGNESLIKKIKEKKKNERRVLWLSSTSNIDELRKHLRRFLRMKKEDGSYIYFRFYDPYVVNDVFPNLKSEQLTDFFEKIDFIIADDARLEESHLFYLSTDKQLQITHQILEDYVDNNR